MLPDSTTLVILWYPKTDEVRWKTFTDWLNGNRAAFYDGHEVEECVPIFLQEDSDPERAADLVVNMRRHRDSARARQGR